MPWARPHVNSPPPLHIEPLRLESALQLLQHAGRELPQVPLETREGLQALVDALVELSSRDALTGLANRRSFELALAREVDRVARSGEPTLMLALDIDHFKRINDTYGHAAGDQVICAVARMLTETVRPMDLVARVGGEEFAVILPSCPAHFGQKTAERIRRKVECAVIHAGVGMDLQVTISVGGAFAPQWVRSSPSLWTERADRQLYRAKSTGRNLVCLEPTAVTMVSAEEKELLFALSPSHDHE
jgi:diguanylate cyclase